jgi:hypothetical protein
MNKITPYIAALLLTTHIAHTTNNGSWTSAPLKKDAKSWNSLNFMSFREEELKAIEKYALAIDNITVEYKNEENKVTVAITGLKDILSAKTEDMRHIISTSHGEIDINLTNWNYWGQDKHHISIFRSIHVPGPLRHCGQPLLEKLTKCDHIEIPVLKHLDLGPLSQNQIRPVFWNVLSVSAEENDNKYIITFNIDPQAGPIKYWDPTWEAVPLCGLKPLEK